MCLWHFQNAVTDAWSRSRHSKAWTRSSSGGSQIPLNYVGEHFQADGKGFNLCVGISAHSTTFPQHWDDPRELCPTGGRVTQGRTPQTTTQPFKIFIFWSYMRICHGDWEFICLRNENGMSTQIQHVFTLMAGWTGQATQSRKCFIYNPLLKSNPFDIYISLLQGNF